MDKSHKAGGTLMCLVGEGKAGSGAVGETEIWRPERELSSLRHRERLRLTKCSYDHKI